MAQARSAQTLVDLLAAETVVDWPRIQEALGGVSAMTVVRYLRQIPSRRSDNHNGRYYCLHERSRYDRLGPWRVGDIHVSVDGGLGPTVRRLVYEMAAGATHRELPERLRVRVHNTLLTLLRRGEIERERLAQRSVSLHRDAAIRQRQIQRRGALPESGQTARLGIAISHEMVIQVLLTLLQHPGAAAAQVVRYLRGHSPPISCAQVEAVCARYDLGSIGNNGGSSQS